MALGSQNIPGHLFRTFGSHQQEAVIKSKKCVTLVLQRTTVLSGSEWGNIIIWDDGVIKLEVSRKNGLPCHSGRLVQLMYVPEINQIVSVGADGFIRMWNYHTIEAVNPLFESTVALEPTFEIEVKDGIRVAELMQIVAPPKDEECNWFGQDKKGGIWKIHVELTTLHRPAELLYTAHVGKALDMSPSPLGQYLAILGEDSRLTIWNIVEKKLVFSHQSMNHEMSTILWLSAKALSSGCAMVTGHTNGLVKVLIVRLKDKLSDPKTVPMKFDDTNEINWIHPIQVRQL
ncbi:hypothetical protein WDU94_015249 [Cyamophila willieti]